MFQFARKGSVEFLESTFLNQCDSLVHAFCTRQSGVSDGHFSSLNVSAKEGDRDDKVRQNGAIIAAAFDLRADQFFIGHQVHGDIIMRIDHENAGSLGRHTHPCDAIITNQPDVAIGIKTADCVPIFLSDASRRLIGVVHAGWRGTSLCIAAKAVAALGESFSSCPSDIVAVIGPAIGPCCYEVDDAVFSADTQDKDWVSAFTPCVKNGKWMLDLPAANRNQLLKAGVSPEKIFSADVCTACRKDIFFSHRAEHGKTGRQLNFMILKKDMAI